MLDFCGCLEGKNILVVENEWLIATDLKRALTDEGALVLGPVGSVNQAFALISRTPAIDAAVLDIHLGAHSDVYPLAAALRAFGVPFVFATGYDDFKIRHDFVSVKHLMKPFTPSAIRDVLAAALVTASTSVRLPATKLLVQAPWQNRL